LVEKLEFPSLFEYDLELKLSRKVSCPKLLDTDKNRNANKQKVWIPLKYNDGNNPWINLMGMTKSILIIFWISEMVLEPAYEYVNVFELALCWFVNLMILVFILLL
tara:strand:+ start:10638 stop:10955 length:318 start_codon:yes stop_codon:yes gene_type:complete